MAKEDRATDAQAEQFENNKAKILLSSSDWDLASKKYLEEVLNGLELMTAYYSYGNGEISIENRAMWNTLDADVVISQINRAIKPVLDIEVSNSSFPTTLWFEWGDNYG